MPYAGVHVVGGLVVTGTPDVIIDLESQGFNPGLNELVQGASGQVYRTFAALMSAAPRFNGATSQLKTFLAKVGVEGLVGAADLYAQLADIATGKRSSGSGHEKFAIATGLILPRQLTVGQNRPARITFDVIGVNAAGTTNPAVRSTAAMPALTGVSELFTLGPVKVNGVAYEGVQDLTIDFGLTEQVHQGSGAIYPQLVFLAEIAPRITIRTDDAGLIAALTVEGLAQSASDSVIYLRKLAQDGIRVADDVAEHISLTIDEGRWSPSEKSGTHPGGQTAGFTMQPTYDGLALPLVLNSAVKII
jgi:hypothetical protein